MMRRSPSTTCVSLPNASKLSLVLAFVTTRSASFRFFLSSSACTRGRPSWMRPCAYQTSMLRMAANSSHRGPIFARRPEDDLGALLVRESVVPTRDGEARGEPLDVPFPRSGIRLVEIVDVEQELALGRAEQAEVRDVGVAARLDDEARSGRRGQVRGHQVGGAAVERERRREHPPVPDRDELLDATLRLLLEEPYRIRATGGRVPTGVAGARNLGASRLAPSGALSGASDGRRPWAARPHLGRRPCRRRRSCLSSRRRGWFGHGRAPS